MKDLNPLFGDPEFNKEGGDQIEDYSPNNLGLIKKKGVKIQLLPEDSVGLWQPLRLKKDIVGNPVGRRPSIGAMEPR